MKEPQGHPTNAAVARLSEIPLEFGPGVFIVSLNYHLHQVMAHYILLVKINEIDSVYVSYYALGLDKSRPAAGGQVDLRDVAGDDRLRSEPDSGEKHLHLFRRGVLRFVQNDERIG